MRLVLSSRSSFACLFLDDGHEDTNLLPELKAFRFCFAKIRPQSRLPRTANVKKGQITKLGWR